MYSYRKDNAVDLLNGTNEYVVELDKYFHNIEDNSFQVDKNYFCSLQSELWIKIVIAHTK